MCSTVTSLCNDCFASDLQVEANCPHDELSLVRGNAARKQSLVSDIVVLVLEYPHIECPSKADKVMQYTMKFSWPLLLYCKMHDLPEDKPFG